MRARRRHDYDSLMVLAGVVLASGVGWWVVVTIMPPQEMWICSAAGLLPGSAMHGLSLAGMWFAMTLAMMLPSATSEILRVASAHHGSPVTSTALPFGVGYLVVTLPLGLAAAGLQWMLESAGLLTGEGRLINPAVGALVLLAIGLCELLMLTGAQQRFCGNGHLAKDTSLLLRGLCYGRSMLPCCVAMIGLQFVGGAMNVAWMAVLTLWMFLEATLPWKRHMTAFAGVALLAAAASVLLSASI